MPTPISPPRFSARCQVGGGTSRTGRLRFAFDFAGCCRAVPPRLRLFLLGPLACDPLDRGLVALLVAIDELVLVAEALLAAAALLASGHRPQSR